MNNEEEDLAEETETTGTDGSGRETTFYRRLVNKRKGADKRFMVVTLAVTGVVVLAVFLYWLSRGGEEGRPVPAPRTMSFGEPNNSGVQTGDATITLTPEEIERAGIKVEIAGEQLFAEQGSTPTTGVVQANAYRETPVISVAGGIVRRVNAQLGEQVRQGQAVAVVFSDELSQTESRYVSLLKELETARQNYEREEKLARISPVSSAELDEATAKLKTIQAELDEHHIHHERVTKLVRIGASSREELEQATTKLRTAEAELAEARRRYDRAVELAQIRPASRSSFEQAAVRVRSAESELSSVRERLRFLGLAPGKIDSLRTPNQISSELALTAPVAGTVTSRSVNVGEVVEANKELMRVTDLSSVWAIAQVYESGLGRIRVGSGATVTSDAYPNQVFRGHVTYIDPSINQETRTAQVRVELDNPGQMLRIGMYVNVAFGGLGEAERTMAMVPAAAVQNVNNQQMVFMPTDQPNVFIMRPVRLAPETSGSYPVIEGVAVGDRVVTEGSFLLRAEWLKIHPIGS